MAGGVSDADAHTMACEMRCDPADIRALAPRKNATQFLTYIDGVTRRAADNAIFHTRKHGAHERARVSNTHRRQPPPLLRDGGVTATA